MRRRADQAAALFGGADAGGGPAAAVAAAAAVVVSTVRRVMSFSPCRPLHPPPHDPMSGSDCSQEPRLAKSRMSQQARGLSEIVEIVQLGHAGDGVTGGRLVRSGHGSRRRRARAREGERGPPRRADRAGSGARRAALRPFRHLRRLRAPACGARRLSRLEARSRRHRAEAARLRRCAGGGDPRGCAGHAAAREVQGAAARR